MKVKTKIFKQLDSVKVLLYSFSDCKYCALVKKFLIEHKIQAQIIDLDKLTHQQSQDSVDILAEITDLWEPPYLFIDGTQVNGYVGLVEGWKDGWIQKLLKKIGVSFTL